MLLLLGCNHLSAPVAVRERMAFGEGDLDAALQRLLERDGMIEGYLLSTCNRVEVLVRSDLPAPQAVKVVREFLESERGVTASELDVHTYHFAGRAAVQHLMRVASGLDSMILGEPQVLGQVRQAYLAANGAGATGSVVERLLQQTLATAKRVRTETGISRHPISVAYAAVHLARRIFVKMDGRRALLLGAGKMAELVARHLSSNGVDEIIVASRTYDRAMASAARCNGRAVHWEDGVGGLAGVDIVISCTGATEPIVRREHVAKAMRTRRGEPLFLIDIAVPRDVDPTVNGLDNVYLYDIDALQNVVDTNLDERRVAARRAERAIDEDVESFDRWMQAQAITPTIVALRERWLDVAAGEVERWRRRLGTLSPEQERALSGMTRSIVQKMLHRPITHLRRSVVRGDVRGSASTYRSIFGLDEAVGGDADDRGGDDVGREGPQRLLKGGKDS